MSEHQRQENALPVKKHIQDRVCWAQGCTKRVLPATRGYRKWCKEHRKEARNAAMSEANKRWRISLGKKVGVYKTKDATSAKTVRETRKPAKSKRAAPKQARRAQR